MLTDAPYWSANWIWSLPLIVVTVSIHSFGLFATHEKITTVLARQWDGRRFGIRFALVMGTTVLLVTVLHAAEGAAWAGAYRALGALPDMKSAMLYSLEAMTTYGHANIALDLHWQMMGALEALNGVILFGLTTAFLFSVIQSISTAGGAGKPGR